MTSEQDFGFKVHSLDNAIVATTSLEVEDQNVIELDFSDYTPLEQFVHNLNMLPSKSKRVANKSLSVNGVVVQDRMEKYLNNTSESSSALKQILKTPRHYLTYKVDELNVKDKSCFELGTFCHSAFLEPKKFKNIIVEPKETKSTRQGLVNIIKFYWDILQKPCVDITPLKQDELKDIYHNLKIEAEASGLTFVKEDHYNIIKHIGRTYNTYGDGILPKIFSHVKPEVSMYLKDIESGVKVKIRPDAIMLEESFGVNGIISVKTTSATSEEAFMRDAAKFKYELSEGMYLDVATKVTGRKFTATLMLMLQTVMPYGIALFYWDAEDLEIGKYKYRHALGVLQQCRKEDRWLGFDCKAENGNHGILPMKLPNYIKLELPPQEL